MLWCREMIKPCAWFKLKLAQLEPAPAQECCIEGVTCCHWYLLQFLVSSLPTVWLLAPWVSGDSSLSLVDIYNHKGLLCVSQKFRIRHWKPPITCPKTEVIPVIPAVSSKPQPQSHQSGDPPHTGSLVEIL